MERTTQACAAFDHPEFVLTCADEVAFDLPWLCNVLEREVASGRRYAPGEDFQLGCSLLMVRNAPGGRLSLWEPDFSGEAGRLDCSVTRSLVLLRRQRAVLESFGLAERLDFPSLRQTAVLCSGYAEGVRRMLFRSEGAASSSGWFFGCREDAHDHERPENLRGGTLYGMACAHPEILDFLAMPVGSMILIDSRGRLEQALGPGGENLAVEPGSYLDRLGRRSKEE